MATFITRNAHTDYMTVLQMGYGMIAKLYMSLCDLLQAEKQEHEKAVSEAKAKAKRK